MSDFETLPPDPPPSSKAALPVLPLALGTALVVSLIGNVALLVRGPETVEAPPVECPQCETCPPPVECPVCEVCEVCEVCPEIEVATATGGSGTGTGGTRPPRVDEAAAAEGEAHLTHAENEGERDPVQVAAQRRVADGVDRIVASHSAASARRFFSRNLPSFASMDCAFRDPAAAEHVRMQLRPMNELLPAAERLTEEQLHRYERDLRCPRE
ncbi:MAG: hypothetical protein J0L92_25700 [Deltaproteobacteria bacterium]|nr:hypothetical protein [Deltaproteobacteria bacterium]